MCLLATAAYARSERFCGNRVEVLFNSTWAPLCAPADVGTWTAKEALRISYLLCQQREQCYAPCTCRVERETVQWQQLALMLSSFQAGRCSGTLTGEGIL